MQTRSSKFEGPLPGCPAADAAVWKRAGRNSAEPPGTRVALKLDASTCGGYVNKLRSCAAAMRAHPESMPGSTQQDICGVIDGLQEWRFQLLGVHYTTGIPKFRHTSLQLLQCIRAMKFLKGGSTSLYQTAMACIRAVLPKAFQDEFVRRCTVAKLNPSPSLIWHGELSVDLALIILEKNRLQFQTGSFYRYDMCDSSEQQSYDWLWSMHREIHCSRIIEVYEAVQSLASAFEEYVRDLKASAGDDEEAIIAGLLAPPQELWKPWLACIKEHVREHINPPAALTSGHKTVVHKAAARLWGWGLQQFKPKEQLEEYRESFVSHCSDLGVEASLPKCYVESAMGLLPSWFCAESGLDLDIDVDIDSGKDLEAQAQHTLSCDPIDGAMLSPDSDLPIDGAELSDDDEEPKSLPASTFPKALMPNAMAWAGLEHVSDNALSEVHKNLVHWPVFFASLKNFEGLLRKPQRRRRLVWTCLHGRRYQKLSVYFKNFSASLYEKRWKEVLRFLRALIPLLKPLALCWDQALYVSGVDYQGLKAPDGDAINADDEPDGERDHDGLIFDPSRLTRDLRDPIFPVYAQAQNHAERVSNKLTEHFGCCPCHRSMALLLSPGNRRRMFKAHYGQGFGSCPMSGSNASGLAAGEITEVLDKLWEHEESELMLYQLFPTSQPLTEEQWSVVLSDFNHMRHALCLEHSIKNHYAGRLPNVMAVLSHLNEDGARAGAVKIIQQIDEDPREEAHDYITWRDLRPGAEFRSQVLKFSQGELRVNLSLPVRERIASIFFTPVIETPAEEKHARVSLESKRRLNPVRVSLANRLPLLERNLTSGKIDMKELLCAFDLARSLRKVPEVLGINLHPDLDDVDYPGSHAQRNMIASIVYRCDLSSMYKRFKTLMKNRAWILGGRSKRQ